jgi:gamma-glutamyltranspeptidase/glutathione hydrolase
MPYRFVLLLGLCTATGTTSADSPSSLPPAAAVASAHPLAADAGVEILQAGGNAFDAAVAISAALGVVEPQSSGIGGGGFWLLYRAKNSHGVMVDGREQAPLAAHRDLFADATAGSGTSTEAMGSAAPDARPSLDGPLAAAIPGQPAALAHIAEHYGRLPLARSLAPAIRLAREGFPVSPAYRRLAKFRLAALRSYPSTAAIFLADGQVPPQGQLIRQPDLARTLQTLADRGRKGFYSGPTATALVRAVRADGGIWTLLDLEQYRVRERRPIEGLYRSMHIDAASPPSSGGVALLSMLNILSGFDLEGADAITRTHLIVEAMRRAYRDRAVYLGDPDFVSVPVELLTDPRYAAGLRASIRPDRAMPSALLPGIEAQPAGPHTSHFSVLDFDGNRVAATLSINYPFGSGFVAAGTGVLLNDEMDDFSMAPGVPNAYGLVGAAANAIEPGKRPLSSMTPTILDDGNRTAVLGTPGGSRIISMVLLATLGFAEGSDPSDWVRIPRFHHQYLPDRIQYEPDTLTNEEVDGLQRLGHTVAELDRPYGNMQAILWDRGAGRVLAASDPRGEGRACIVAVAAESNDPSREQSPYRVRCGAEVAYPPRTPAQSLERRQ